MAGCITDYIIFCRDTVLPLKTVHCYSNNKPWITSDIKHILNKKKEAFKAGDRSKQKEVQQELKRSMKAAKMNYKKKLEARLQHNNTKEVWRGMQTITGYKGKRSQPTGNQDRANEFNLFYNRFDVPPPSKSASTSTSAHPPATSPPAPTSPLLDSHSNIRAAAPCTSTSPIPLFFTVEEVRVELGRLRPCKAAGPDGVSPRLLKECRAQLASPLQILFNLSLHSGKVPALWKTSCLVPLPKVVRATEVNQYRPVALTSHIMKTLERLILCLLRPQVQHALDHLQFAYQEKLGVDDAVLYMLHRAHSFLDELGGYVRVLFLDFSSAFDTIQPCILKEKMEVMGVDSTFVSWIHSYLTGRLQFVRLGNSVSSRLVSNVGAPQGTVLAPFLFTLYTADFKYQSETCHIQKYSDDTAIVACIKKGQEDEYRDLTRAFCDWSKKNCLIINTTKTKEMIINFSRSKHNTQLVNIDGQDIETVNTYKYLGVNIDNKLDWSLNSEGLYKKAQTRLYFLRRLKSFNVCNTMLKMFYQSVVAAVLFYAAVCWGNNITARDCHRLDKLVKRAGSVVGGTLDSVGAVVERCMKTRVQAILRNTKHPLHDTLVAQKSSRNTRLLSVRCRTERYKRSFIPAAVRFYNAHWC